MKVLVIDTIAPEGIAHLTERGFQVDQVSSKLERETLLARLGDYEGIVTRSSTAVTPEFLGRARRLRILGRAGVGVDNIDVDACSRQGVVVVNAPYGNVVSAAEHTVGMLLALVRKIPTAHEALRRLVGPGHLGSELFRKTAGVLGLGKVGSRVAARLRAFDMEVLVTNRHGLGDEVLLRVVDHFVGAELARARRLLLGAVVVMTRAPMHLRDLDRRARDAAARRLHEHGLAGSDLPLCTTICHA